MMLSKGYQNKLNMSNLKILLNQLTQIDLTETKLRGHDQKSFYRRILFNILLPHPQPRRHQLSRVRLLRNPSPEPPCPRAPR